VAPERGLPFAAGPVLVHRLEGKIHANSPFLPAASWADQPAMTYIMIHDVRHVVFDQGHSKMAAV
jgi:hypothetical protein